MMEVITGMESRTISIISMLAAVVMLQACASMQATGYDRFYAESFEVVNQRVEQSIQITNLAVLNTYESPDASVVTYRIGQSSGSSGSNAPIGARSMSHEEGKVTVKETPNGKVQVSVENPDYNFTVPEHEKADYRDILFKALDQIEEQQAKNNS